MAPATRDLVFWLAAAVSIPLTLFAAQPFFTSAWRSLAKFRTNMDVPISAAIVLSLALSVYQTALHGTHVYFDAAVMLTFLLLVGRYLDFLMRDRARGAARQLLAFQSVPARRLAADDTVESVPARDIHPGDRVLLASGERAPVDGTLDDAGTELDVSLVTGESAPVAVARGGTVHAGSIVAGAPVILRATARASDSLVADLARLLEAGQQTRNLYVRLAERAARAYVPFVAVLSLLVLAGWLAAGASLSQAMTNAITVLIITCPCALGLAVPAVQIVATSRLFNRGLFVKSGDALERLAEIDTAVFDKTGTLTFGAPQVTNAHEIPQWVIDDAARLARASNHPLARAVASAAGAGPVAAEVQEVAGCGLECREGGRLQRLGKAEWCGAESGSDASELWFRDGDAAPLRFSFHDALRPDAAAALDALRARGIHLMMLSGDRSEVTSVLARELGMADWRAEIDPKGKASLMRSLRAKGRHVLMVGDGLNDAAALALAHVSIAPGTAADISQRAADMVLRGASLMPIVEALDVARKARRIVFENFAIAGLYNLTAIPLAALGLIMPLIAAATMAASSLLVTLNALRAAAGARR
jgi:Cu2+-exporting ATPase